MNAEPQSETPVEALTRELWDVPIRVRLVSYVVFSHDLEEQLIKLVARWQDKAAPCAMLQRR